MTYCQSNPYFHKPMALVYIKYLKVTSVQMHSNCCQNSNCICMQCERYTVNSVTFSLLYLYHISFSLFRSEEKSDFDFMDEMSSPKFTPRRTGEGGPKGSAKKKTTSLDGILSNMRRHRELEKMEKQASENISNH